MTRLTDRFAIAVQSRPVFNPRCQSSRNEVARIAPSGPIERAPNRPAAQMRGPSRQSLYGESRRMLGSQEGRVRSSASFRSA